MTLAKYVVACLVTAACVFVFGYMAGKRTVPARVEERIVTKEVIKWQEKIVNQSQTNASQSSQENVKVVTRWRTLPSGEKMVEQSRERASSATAVTSGVRSVTRDFSLATSSSSQSTRITVYPPRKPWTVAALAGVDLRLVKHLGLTVTRELGPLTVGAWALPTAQGRPMGLTLGFRF